MCVYHIEQMNHVITIYQPLANEPDVNDNAPIDACLVMNENAPVGACPVMNETVPVEACPVMNENAPVEACPVMDENVPVNAQPNMVENAPIDAQPDVNEVINPHPNVIIYMSPIEAFNVLMWMRTLPGQFKPILM
jgi:hypothetical protein